MDTIEEQNKTPRQQIVDERKQLSELLESREEGSRDALRASLDRIEALKEVTQFTGSPRWNMVPVIFFAVSAIVILCLSVVPVTRTSIEIQLDTEYFWVQVPGSMSGWGENYGNCSPFYYNGGMQLWPILNAVEVHALADSELTIARRSMAPEYYGQSNEFWLMRSNGEPFLLDSWGIAGDTELVVRRIPTEQKLTLQFKKRSTNPLDSWWLPCVAFTVLPNAGASDTRGSAWMLSVPKKVKEYEPDELAAEFAGNPPARVVKELNAHGLYTSSSNERVTLDVKLANSFRQPIYSGMPVAIEALKLGPWEEESPKGCANQKFKPIRGGTVRLLELNRVIQLWPSDCLDIDWKDLYLMGVETSWEGVHLSVRGSASKLSVFTSVESDEMPSLLEWLYAQQRLAVIWGAIVFLGGLGISLYRWLRQSE